MDLETSYLITVDADQAIREEARVEQGFTKIATQAKAADTAIAGVEKTTRTFGTSVNIAEQAVARGRASLAAFARAGVQAKNDIERVGGVQKLTTAEIEKSINVIGRAQRAYETLGRTAPADLDRLRTRLVAMKTANEEMAGASTKVTTAAGAQTAMLSRLTGAFAGYLSVGAILGAIKSTAQYADTLQTTAARTGLTVEAVQRLGFAARQNGTNLDRLTSSLNLMQDRLASGNEQADAALRALGLSATMLAQMKPDQQLFAISDALKSVGSHNQKIAILNDLFGRGGSELLPLFASEMRKTATEADRMGQVIDASTVAALARMDDEIENVTIAGRGLIANFLSPLLPYLEGATQQALALAGAWNAVLAGQAHAGQIADFLSAAGSQGGGMGLLGMMTPQGIAAMINATRAKGAGPGQGDIDLDQNAALNFTLTDRVVGQLNSKLRDTNRLTNNSARDAERMALAYANVLSDIAAFESGRGMRGGRPETKWIGGIPVGQDVNIDAADSFFGAGSAGAFYALMQAQGAAATQFQRPPSRFEGGIPVGQLVDLDAETSFYGSGRKAADSGRKAADDFSDSFSDRLGENLKAAAPQLMADFADAFTGKGPHASVGGNLAANLAQTGVQVLGDAIIPGLGQVLAPIVGELLYKPSMRANDMRDDFIAQNGGLGNLNRRAVEAGGNLNALLRADNPELLQRAIEDLTRTIEQAEQQRRADLRSLGGPGLVNPNTIVAVGSRRGFLGGEAEQAALEQFLTSNLGRAAGGFSNFFQSGGQVSAGNASGFGGGIAAIFGERTGAGENPLAVLQSLEPIITQATDRFVALGVDGGAAFSNIAALAIFAKDEAVAPAMAQVAALNDVLIGLGNTALLDQETFAGLAATVSETYNSLVAQGKDGDQALRLMQPTLQTLWELEQDRGFVIDETTEKMLRQAEAAGIVGEDFRSAQDKMVAALDRLIGRLDTLISEMFPGLGGAAQDAAGDVEDAFRGVDVTIPVKFQYPNGGDYGTTPTGQEPAQAYRGGYVTPYGVQLLALGGPVRFQPRGTDTVPAMLTPGEFVMRRDAVDRIGADTLAGMNRGDGGGTVINNFYISATDGESVARMVKSREFLDSLSDAEARNTHGRRTKLRAVTA